MLPSASRQIKRVAGGRTIAAARLCGSLAQNPKTMREGTMIERRKFLKVSAATIAGIAAPSIARAADYPTRPVRLVVGWLPGSAADVVARILTNWMSEKLGQAVIVENKAGAGSNFAAQ